MDKIVCTINKNEQSFLYIYDKNLTQNVIDHHIILEQDAYCSVFMFLVDVTSITCNLHIHLRGDRSHVEIKGLYALDDAQQVKINTYQYHQGKDSKSNLVLKGMLKGKARAHYQGMIKIDHGATGTDAAQTNKNIVLSRDAKVVSIPSIEVLQHDVQCCHGSAIGKFDKQQLWYLQSKGLQPEQAQKLLVKSFFQDVLDGVSNQAILLDTLCQKMI